MTFPRPYIIGKSPFSIQTFNLVVSSNENNFSLNTKAAAAGYVEGAAVFNITVDSGVVLGTTSTTYALNIESQTAESIVNLTNNGTINGKGGSANSGAGGTALKISYATNLTNNSLIFGGGGGGGQGGSSTCGGTCCGTRGTGGGGSGGAGRGNSAAASGSSGGSSSGSSCLSGDEGCDSGGSFSVTGGAGGAGGAAGTAGAAGSGGAGGGCSGGSTSSSGGSSGGGAGKWVEGLSNLTILVAGTVAGGTS